MSLLVINNVLMLINISFGVWFVVAAISHIFTLPKCRDLRPLVLPIFVTLGYVILQLVVFLVYVKNPDNKIVSHIDIVWRLIEGGFIYSLNLVVEAHTKIRDYKEKRELVNDGLATN